MLEHFGKHFDLRQQLLSVNIAETEVFLQSHPATLNLPNFALQYGYRLFQSETARTSKETPHSFRLIADSTEHSETVYIATTIAKAGVHPFSNLIQVLIWRTNSPKHQSVLTGFPSAIFAHLINTHDIVVTENDLNPHMRTYWHRRILEAVSMTNRHAYYIDPLLPVLREISDVDDFYHHLESIVPGDAVGTKSFILSSKNI